MKFPWEKKEPEPTDTSERLEKRIESAIREIMTKYLADAESFIAKIKSTFDLGKEITGLKEQLETLRIEKGRKEEEYARKDREIEHKVGLERKRQEFEIAQAKREALVGVKEENLKADQARFTEQLKFHEDRFSKEVGYLKEILTDIVKRLPTAEFKTETKVIEKK